MLTGEEKEFSLSEWCSVKCPTLEVVWISGISIRKTNLIQAVKAVQYVRCESKIRQRMSPVSSRLNLDFYKCEAMVRTIISD